MTELLYAARRSSRTDANVALVTHNTEEFQSVAGLKLDDWES